MISKNMVVQASVGLHARPAAEFSQIAAAATCEVLVGRVGAAKVKANSPLRLLTLKIKQGEEITVSINTDDQKLALPDAEGLQNFFLQTVKKVLA